jgi:outer membrane biosynthesis protein TonB
LQTGSIDQLERDLFETPTRKLPIILAGGISLVILILTIFGGGVFYNSLSSNSAKVANINTNVNKPSNIVIAANVSNSNLAETKPTVTPITSPTPKPIAEIKSTPIITPKATSTPTPEIVKPTPKVQETPIVVSNPRPTPKPAVISIPRPTPKPVTSTPRNTPKQKVVKDTSDNCIYYGKCKN